MAPRATLTTEKGIQTDVSDELVPMQRFIELEGFIIQGGKLVKPNGLKVINPLRLSSRIVGISEWRKP